jgi:hypothetical protein
MVPLVGKPKQVEDAKPITEKEYRRYRRKLAKETLRKLKYPNGKPIDKTIGYKFDLLTRLSNRAANLSVDLSGMAPKDSSSSSTSTDSEIENEMLKSQD